MNSPVLLALGVLCLPLGAMLSAAEPSALERQPDGIVVPTAGGLLKLQVCSADIVRVAFSADRAFFDRESYMLDPQRAPNTASWTVEEGADEITLRTGRLQVRVNRATGAVAFFDAAGQPLLAERAGGRTLEPAEVMGEKTAHVRQVWTANDDESLYGLGHHQLGLMDLKGWELDLWQHNGTLAIPFLVSSRGYGILWDNNSYTHFGDTRPLEFPPAARLIDAEGNPGGLTGSYFSGRNFDRLVATRIDPQIAIGRMPDDVSVGQIPSGETAATVATKRLNAWVHPALGNEDGPISVRWEGSIEPTQSGEHLFQTFSNAGIKVWIDGTLVIDHWRQGWLPWKDVAKVALTAGKRHAVRIEWVRDETPTHLRFQWKTPAPDADTSLWSEVGDGIDYYFVHGSKLDEVIAGYRTLTGAASLLPKWAFGLWQSRQRYETQQQSLDVLAEFRRRRIPLDVIVQDWFYWPADGWGSHKFDAARFPDPDAWIREIHDKYHARLLLSVWPKFYAGTETGKAFEDRGWLYEPNRKENIRDWLGYNFTFYDAFNPAARKLFWQQIEPALYRRGVDAWWLDGSEPDLLPAPDLWKGREHIMPTMGGTGARILNVYPQLNSRAIYEGQRSADPDKRVTILTRSSFAGMQRYAGATWSGDTSSTWTALAKQLPAALGYSLSGMPYWTMDIGGFSVPERFNTAQPTAADLEDWRELNTRWFQFGALTPMLRVHGERPLREMWFFGADEGHPAYDAQLKFAQLHYRLLPYIYSVAGDVTQRGGSFLRALVMDFPTDSRARAIGDQYLFGPALLVSPVVTPKTSSRPVYLPATPGGWYDFWTGAALAGGRTIDASSPYDTIPVHVRAGSIVPFGPELQYSTEKPADPLTVWIYAGADGEYSFYEDDGTSYGYERGEFTRIPFRWNDRERTLTIGARQGRFTGMLAERTLHVVLVRADKPLGFSTDPRPERSLRYTGEALDVKFE